MADKMKDIKKMTSSLKDGLKEMTEAFEKTKDDLQKLSDDMIKSALEVKADFDNEKDEAVLNNLSSSIATVIHENSPYLDEMFEGDSWKKVLKAGLPVPPIKKDIKKEDKKNEK
jgi:uncharacterized phage infection (PIP) family protein YhgE